MNPNNNISQELLEMVERYLNNTMPEHEHNAFENRMATEPSFKTIVEDIKTLLFGIEKQALKEKLEDFHKAIPNISPEKKVTKVRYLYFKLTAAAVLVVAIGSFWFSTQNNSSQKLYTKYFSPDPGLATTMSQNSNYNFYNAMVDYKQGNYKSAIVKWKQQLINKPSNDSLNYFIGVAYLANNEENEAIPFLENVTKNINSTFNRDAFYYLGMTYLKNNKVELAKKNLTFSSIGNSKEILLELDK